jgi:hypothetical protein
MTTLHAIRAYHVRHAARIWAEHANAKNRHLHIPTTIVAYLSLLALAGEVPLAGGVSLGALYAGAATLYLLSFDAVVALVLTAFSGGLWLSFGGHFALTAFGPVVGTALPLLVYLAVGQLALASHRWYGDSFALRPERGLWRVVLITHTVLFAVGHFVLYALFHLGYRPALRARVEADGQARAQMMKARAGAMMAAGAGA